MADLRKIFSGEKRTWPDGSKVKLFSRAPGTPERDALPKLLGKSETEYKQYWTGKIYQGDAESEPIVLPSNGMRREALTAYPGAITLVDSADVKAGMKVLILAGSCRKIRTTRSTTNLPLPRYLLRYHAFRDFSATSVTRPG